MADFVDLTIVWEHPLSKKIHDPKTVINNGRVFMDKWLDSGAEGKTLADYASISPAIREEIGLKMERNSYFRLDCYRNGKYERAAEFSSYAEHKKNFLRLTSRVEFRRDAWYQIKDGTLNAYDPSVKNSASHPFTQDVSRIVSDGIKTQCEIHGLPFPNDFLNQVNWGGMRLSLLCRVDPGLLTMSIEGEYVPLRMQVLKENKNVLLIGCQGLGWYLPDPEAVKQIDRQWFRLSMTRPGTLLSLAGYKRVNGKMPGMWTERDLARASMSAMDRGR